MDATKSEIMDLTREFNENFEKIHSQLALVKQMNSVISERIVSRECQYKCPVL